jgi:hypothetical protein
MDSRVRKLSWALLGIAVSGLIGSLLVGVVVVAQIRSAQVDRAPKNDANDATLAIIRDCTEPTGDCFREAQRRTAEAVGDINRVIVIAAACASKPYEQSVTRIAKCVTRRLADAQDVS